MTMIELLTLIALVGGPIAAVCITLWMEHRRQTMQRRMYVVRMMLTTRHMPADPKWNAAINLIPVEFHDKAQVMQKWREFHERANVRTEGNQLDPRFTAAQSGLINEVLKASGLTNLSEGDIQTMAYISTGFVNRDVLYLDSLRAMAALAETMDKQRALTQRIVDALPPRAEPRGPTGPPVGTAPRPQS
jgi:hypothetical protein